MSQAAASGFGGAESKGDAMGFTTEPAGYPKPYFRIFRVHGKSFVSLSSTAAASGTAIAFHTDEAMSWETVRNLNRMPPLVLIIRNLCMQG